MRGFMGKRSWRFVAGTAAGFLVCGGALAVAQFPKQTWPGSTKAPEYSATEVAMLLAGIDGGQNAAGASGGALKAPEPNEPAATPPAPAVAGPAVNGPALAAPALNDPAGGAVAVNPVAAADKDMAAEVLASGPIHEAFANPTALNPQPGLVVPKKPADTIEELPPEQKPEGKQVEWIPGYWAWDDPREDFIWVSGVWRDIPPGRRWVPGYWGETAGGWQWTPGFWAAAQQEEIEYQPAPPESLEVGPSSVAPSDGHFWVPGCWVWRDVRYTWRPGYWWAASPDWVWVPHYYSWSPRGYVLCGGYWDWLVHRRGICYAPVYYNRPIYAGVGYYWSPSICFDVGSLHISLFARPNYCHYYYGNYYDPWCARSGIYFWANYHHRRGCYDPIYSHYRWDHVHRRGERDWEQRVNRRYEHFVANADARPARTYAEAAAWRGRGDRIDRDQLEAIRAVRPIDELARDNRLATRLERVDERNRENFRRGARDLQHLAVDRGDIELRRPPRDGGRDGGRDGDREGNRGNGNRGPDRGDLAGNRGDRPGADRPGADRPGADRPGIDRPGAGRPGAERPDSGDVAGNRGDRPDRVRPGADSPGGERPGTGRAGGDGARDNAASGNLRMPRPRDIDATVGRGSAPATRPDGSPRIDRGPRRPGTGEVAPRPDGITSTPDSVARPGVTRPSGRDRPDVTRPDVTRPEVTRPGITRPDVTRPEVTRPEVTRPEVTRPGVTRPEVTRPDVTRPEVTRPRPSIEGHERPSRPSVETPRPTPRESAPAVRERPSRPESRPPSVDRAPRVDRGPSRPSGGESRPSRPSGGESRPSRPSGGESRPSGRSRTEAAPTPRPSTSDVARPDLNRARNEAARSAMADAARSRSVARPSPAVTRSAPEPRAAARPAPSPRADRSVSRQAPTRVVPDRAPPQRSFTPAPRPTPSFQRPSAPSGGPSVRQAPPARQDGGGGERANRRDRGR